MGEYTGMGGAGGRSREGTKGMRLVGYRSKGGDKGRLWEGHWMESIQECSEWL